MKVTIFGSGYVGLVTGACLAEVGNNVLCVDADDEKIGRLRAGELPIFEPGLDQYLSRNIAAGRLAFTSDAGKAVDHGPIVFIAVGTPQSEDGSADLSHVRTVARSIGNQMSEYRLVVNKSTVPVGTADSVREEIEAALSKRDVSMEFDVVSNPEFLKEGAAIGDFMKPDRIIVGTDNPASSGLLKVLYEPFNRNHDRLVVMDTRSAELTKYAANAMLATKISFMNEMANIAERVGADIEQVRVGIGSDPRIGYDFIYPGAGYGGSCLPKDMRSLSRSALDAGYTADILRAVDDVNNRQKRSLATRILDHFDNDLDGKTVALWGLAFKPNTDDMREASSRVVIEMLRDKGAVIRAYDPKAMNEARRLYSSDGSLQLCDSAYEAASGADALAILTEWQEFRSPDFERLRSALSRPVIFDGRNLYNPGFLAALGFTYYSIGRQQLRPNENQVRSV